MNVQAALYSTFQGEQFTDFDVYIYNVKLSPGKSLFCLFKYEAVSVLAPLIHQSLSLHVTFSFMPAFYKVRPDRLDWIESGTIR